MNGNNRDEDPLQWPAAPPPPGGAKSADESPATSHMKTYTAGEDKSRLQQAARELGLAQARKPRRQVRKGPRRSASGGASSYAAAIAQLHLPPLLQAVLDVATEDARMRSMYSSHARMTEEERNLYFSSLPGWAMDTLVEEEEEEGDDEEEGEGGGDDDIIDDGHGPIGGDLVSAVVGIIKGMVGPAILYLPHGFAEAGYVVALPMMVVCTAVFLYCASSLLQAWKYESEKAAAAEEGGSGAAAEGTPLLADTTTTSGSRHNSNKRVMLSYPELAYRALGERGETMVKTGIALMQSGVCLTYLIFVPQNMHASFQLLFGWNVSPTWWLLVMIALQVPLSWIRDIRKLTPTNFLANCLILYGLLTCIGFALREAMRETHDVGGPVHELGYHLSHLQPFAKDWFLFIGTSVLLFEGTITLLVPFQEAVVTKEQRAQFPAVFQRVIICIIAFYMVFGIINWAAYGQEVRTVLTTSLPPGVLATTVQLAYSVAVIFTFPLQNFPALEIATRSLSASIAKVTSADSVLKKRNVLSSLLVCALAVVAALTMNSLDKVVSLMGSLLGCPIAFVFPPLIQLQLMGHEMTATQRGMSYFVMGLGVVAMGLASATTILTWND